MSPGEAPFSPGEESEAGAGGDLLAALQDAVREDDAKAAADEGLDLDAFGGDIEKARAAKMQTDRAARLAEEAVCRAVAVAVAVVVSG